jgi:peptide/nickel transport system substrate-binding protein
MVAGQPPARAAHGRTLTVGISQGIDSLNPFLAVFSASTEMGRLMYDFLTRYSATDATPIPGLAERWSTTPDGRTWTYTIRSGARWSDGQPVTAADVAFTIHLIMTDPDAATANGSFVTNIDAVSAPDAHTVLLHTKTPSATMLALDIPIVPEHVWRRVPSIKAYANDRMPVVGDGPYQLVGYEPDQYLRFRANRRYWGGQPTVDTLVFRYFTNTDAEVQALLAGEIDLVGADANLTPAQFTVLRRTRHIAVHRGAGRRFTELAVNPCARTRTGTPIGDGHPALADERVRRAIGYAINRRTLVSRVLGGYGRVGAGYLPPAFPRWSWQPAAGDRVSYDPATANRILDAAGYRRGDGGVRRMPGTGRPLRLRLLGNADHPADQVVLSYLQGWLRDVGIATETQSLTTTRLADVTAAGDYDLFLGGYQTDPDPDAALALQTCGQRPDADGRGGNSDSFFCDPAYDALYQRQRADLDPARRVADVAAAQRELYQRSAQIILYYQDALEAYRADRFVGFTTQPSQDGVITRQAGYWGYLSPRPASGATGRRQRTGTGLGLGVILLLGVGLLGYLRHRRAATVDERE